MLNQPLLDDGFLWKMGSTHKIALSNHLIAKQTYYRQVNKLGGGGTSFLILRAESG